jgi:hypothetical protein
MANTQGARTEGDSMEVNDGSRAGDAFRPRSPVPFAVVTEAAPVRERERVLDRQRFGRVWGRRLPSHQYQLYVCICTYIRKGRFCFHISLQPPPGTGPTEIDP